MTSDRYIYFFSLAVPSAYLPCPSIHGILEAAVDRTRYTVPHTGHFRQWIHTRAVFSLPVITRFRLHAGAATDKYSRWRPGHEGAFASRETSGWSPPPPPPPPRQVRSSRITIALATSQWNFYKVRNCRGDGCPVSHDNSRRCISYVAPFYSREEAAKIYGRR